MNWYASGTPVNFAGVALARAAQTNVYRAAPGFLALDFKNGTTSVASQNVALQGNSVSILVLTGNASDPMKQPMIVNMTAPLYVKPDAGKCFLRFLHAVPSVGDVSLRVMNGTQLVQTISPLSYGMPSPASMYHSFNAGTLTFALYSSDTHVVNITQADACNPLAATTVVIAPSGGSSDDALQFTVIDDDSGIGQAIDPPAAPAAGAASFYNVFNLLSGTTGSTEVRVALPVLASQPLGSFAAGEGSGWYSAPSSRAEVKLTGASTWGTMMFQEAMHQVAFLTGVGSAGGSPAPWFTILNSSATFSAGARCAVRFFHGAADFGAVTVYVGNATSNGTTAAVNLAFRQAAPTTDFMMSDVGSYNVYVYPEDGSGTLLLNQTWDCVAGAVQTVAVRADGTTLRVVAINHTTTDAKPTPLPTNPPTPPPSPPASSTSPPPPPTPAPPSNKSGCFSGAVMVTLIAADGTRRAVPVSALRVGDRIESVDTAGKVTVDTVFRVTEHSAGVANRFVAITTATGNVVEMTPNHYLHVGAIDQEHLTLASDVKVGDALFVVRDGAVVRTTVTQVGTVDRTGFYNAHTVSGNIVANGVVATHFTTESTWHHRSVAKLWYWALANMPLALRRAIGDVPDVRL